MKTLKNCKWLAATLLLLHGAPCKGDSPQKWSDDIITEQECPSGSAWVKRSYDFDSTVYGASPNSYDYWLQTRGTPYTGKGPGLAMPLQAGLGHNDTAFQSTSEWRPPVYAKIQYTSTGFPGIPSTFNFRKEGQPGFGELDFIVASIETGKDKAKHFISTPLWTPDGKGGLRKLRTLDPGREVEVNLAVGTLYATNISAKTDNFDGNAAEAASYFDQNWGITWKGFEPAKAENTYAVKWLDTSIDWYAGSKNDVPLRITLKKTTSDETFPTGPLPVTLGPWESPGD